jgi:hypothetical protein
MGSFADQPGMKRTDKSEMSREEILLVSFSML